LDGYISQRGCNALAAVAWVTWVTAFAVQQRVPVSLAYAVVDATGHAAAAAICTVWLIPAWGVRPFVVAILASALIDLDHAVVAGSLEPARMMALGARPATHSLAGALLIGVLGWAIGGRRVGYAAFVGAMMHVVQDARAKPGVPLLTPLSADDHVIVGPWVSTAVLLAFALLALLATRRRPRFSRARRAAANP